MGKHKKSGKESRKYNPLINKLKRLEKQAKNHPNDKQSAAELQKLK